MKGAGKPYFCRTKQLKAGKSWKVLGESIGIRWVHDLREPDVSL